MKFQPAKLISRLFPPADPGLGYSPVDSAIIDAYNSTRAPGDVHTLCHAPFKSLRFTQFGKVTVCWKNERHILGEYPGDSVHDIWFGKQAELLRDYIRHNDLSLGCEICKGHLTRGEYFDLRARDFDSKPTAQNGYPSFGEFVLGSACNLECIMCSGKYSSSIRKNREMKPIYPDPYDGRFVEQLEEFIPHFTYTCYFGGEPFYYGLHYKIWDKIIERNPNCDITVQTNATLVNDRIRKLLERGKFNIYMSIDSMHPSTYEKIRVNSSFDKIMENVRYFTGYCHANKRMIRISACPMRQNWQDMPEIVNYCNTHNIEVKFNPIWFPPDCSLWNWDLKSLNNIYEYYHQMTFPVLGERSEANINHFTKLKEQILQWSVQSGKLIHENGKTESPSAESLRNTLFERIRLYFQNDHPFVGSPDLRTSDDLIGILERILSVFGNPADQTKVLHSIIQYPVDYLVREIDANPEDVTLERFKMSTRQLPVRLTPAVEKDRG